MLATILFILIILLVLALGGTGLYLWYSQETKKKRELEAKLAREKEETTQRILAFLKTEIEHVREAVDQFSRSTNFQAGYFPYHQLSVWKETYARIFQEIKDQKLEDLGLEPTDLETVRAFANDYGNAETLRADYNKRFLDEELKRYSGFFDTVIPGKKLDLQQRTAIVTDEDNNLVIAGAGTGKTTTILGKVHYVVDRYATDPQEILLISFTNKSASDLASRMRIGGIEVKTFHKFGKDVIAEIDGRPPSIFDEDQFQLLLTRFFKELLQDLGYLGQVIEFFTEFLKRPKSPFEFQNQGEYIQYLKDQNFRTYKQKQIDVRGRTTYKMEVVKSVEECRIANFLYFNGVDYEYEFPYEFDTSDSAHRAYKPDFTIQQNGRKVYLEHLAVARNGSIPSFFAKEGETYQAAKTRYWDKIRWARETHKSHSTRLIETFSYEMSEGVLFKNLTQKLKEAGIELHPKSPEEIWQIIQESAQDEVDSFLTLLQTFIILLKSNNYSIADVVQRNTQTQDPFEKARNALLIAIIEPIFERYQKYLAERREIDFGDMINQAAQYIAEGKYAKRYRYVIIDEFQDISIGRYHLVRAIRAKNPDCKLFCVGDDWQSIYRFTGSDIALFREFEKFFGYTVKSKIETTYRFHEPLIKLSSDFILRNPNQERKALRGPAAVPRSTDYEIVYSVSENQDDTLALKQVFDEMIATIPDPGNKQVYVLGRYSFDIDRIKNSRGLFRIDRGSRMIRYDAPPQNGARRTVEAQYLTVHKAKGLEADIVIVLNCNSGKHGFPSEMSDDPVLNLLLTKADQFENGEERRLFYVAMTRAKEKVFFIADSSYKSEFITELEVESGSTAIKKCPRCKTADLVRKSGTKNGRPWAFYGCTNYLYGCDYQEWIN